MTIFKPPCELFDKEQIRSAYFRDRQKIEHLAKQISDATCANQPEDELVQELVGPRLLGRVDVDDTGMARVESGEVSYQDTLIVRFITPISGNVQLLRMKPQVGCPSQPIEGF